jgi:hypothetical protein
MESGCTDPYFFCLFTRWRRVVSFTPRPLCHKVKNFWWEAWWVLEPVWKTWRREILQGGERNSFTAYSTICSLAYRMDRRGSCPQSVEALANRRSYLWNHPTKSTKLNPYSKTNSLLSSRWDWTQLSPRPLEPKAMHVTGQADRTVRCRGSSIV